MNYDLAPSFILETETILPNGLVVSTYVDDHAKRYYSVVRRDSTVVRACHHRPGTLLETARTYAMRVAKHYTERFM